MSLKREDQWSLERDHLLLLSCESILKQLAIKIILNN